jgi:hypothetical protein
MTPDQKRAAVKRAVHSAMADVIPVLVVDAAIEKARSTPAIAASAARPIEGPDGWAVWVSADTSFIEFASLMSGLRDAGIECAADHFGDGVMVLRPRYPERGGVMPSAHLCAELMQRPFPRIYRMVQEE